MHADVSFGAVQRLQNDQLSRYHIFKMKKFLSFLGIWLLINMIAALILSGDSLKRYADPSMNFVTIPLALVIQAAILRYRKNKEETIASDDAIDEIDEIENGANEETEREPKTEYEPEKIEMNTDIEKEDDPIRQLFLKSYYNCKHLWEERTKSFNLHCENYDILLHDKKALEKYEKDKDIFEKENAARILKRKINFEERTPQELLMHYRQYLSHLQVEYDQICIVSTVKKMAGNIQEMELDSIAPLVSHSVFGFNNVYIEDLLEIWAGNNTYYFFYPEFVIVSNGPFSNSFDVVPLENVSVIYIEKEYTERIERTDNGTEYGRYIYVDEKGMPPVVNVEGNVCSKKKYGKIRLTPWGQEWFFKKPSEGRKVAVALQKYIAKYRSYNIDGRKNPLDDLVGLKRVKEEIATLTNYIKIKQKRDEMEMKSPNISYHCVFSGNPGTGKTTVARILAGIYRDLGILNSGHLVETDRSGLVAEYVGQTAVKTNKIIDNALDGVLFIDEAYTLTQGGKEDFGSEAIATLLKRMEDDRDRLVVIIAGYTKEIEDFVNSNPGLRSRFNRYIHFDDYSADELYEIFCLQMKKNEYTLTDDAALYLRGVLEKVVVDRPKDFGNARYVRNLFEHAIENQADRLAMEPNITKEKLKELKTVDFK